MHRLILIVCLIPSLALADSWRGVPRVIDGDSISISGQELRLLNIDAFETEQICWNAAEVEYRCGLEATKELRSVIAEREVYCEGKIRDRYGRPLVHCWMDQVDLSAAMVRSGWALAEWKPQYRQEQDLAKAERLGAWSGTFERPKLWRKLHPRKDRPSDP